MPITTNSVTYRDFDVQMLTDVVKGAFAQKDAFMGSTLVSGGAVNVNGTMPYGDANFIGSEVTIPYFGSLGDFVDNPDGTSVTTKTIAMTNEKATIARKSLAFEVSKWAQYSGPDDPYKAASADIVKAATRAMDQAMIDAAMTTPLAQDVYNASTPVYLTYDLVSDARALWGDEDQDVVAMLVHSRTLNDMRKLKDTQGRPLVIDSQASSDVPRFCGMPLILSDKCPVTGSSMGTVTSSGTGTEPVATLAGTPLKPMKLWIRVSGTTLTLGTAKINFSTDGGVTWSGDITTATAGNPVSLIDPAIDSIVGVNGKTGITVSFAGDFANADNLYKSAANLKATSLIVRRGAMGYWYNANALALDTDKNVLAHTDIAAMHLYQACKLYRRSPGHTTPGVIKVQHNVSGFIGTL